MPSARVSRRLLSLIAAALLVALCCTGALAAGTPGGDELLVSIPTRAGVTVKALLLLPPNGQPVRAAAILFPGDQGDIGLGGEERRPTLKKGGNFLVRTRALYAAQGIAVLAPDAPSDQPGGMSPSFRFSDEHVADVRALCAFLRERSGLAPWLVGTSYGSISATYAAARLKDAVAGVALASSVTRVSRKWNMPPHRVRGAMDAGLDSLRVPVLIVRHRDDACPTSPPDNAPRMMESLQNASQKELLTYEGGLPLKSEPCEAKSPHGYYGLDEEAAGGIIGFILRNQPGAAR